MKKTPCAYSGFTAIEILVASAALLVVSLGVYSLMYSINLLAAKNTAINSTSTDAHITLDQLEGMLQTSYTVPTPIDSTGAVLSSNLSLAATLSTCPAVVTGTAVSVTGTGVGIKFFRYVGGPYIPTIPSGNLSGTATSITIELDTAANVPVPIPQPNDILLINTTAISNGGNQAWATVGPTASSTSAGTSSTRIKYTVPLTSPMRVFSSGSNNTVTTGTIGSIAYQASNSGSGCVIYSASLLRPTAFVITTSGSQASLNWIDRYTTDASQKVILTGTNNHLLTNHLVTSGTNPPFAIVYLLTNSGSAAFVSVALQVQSWDYNNVLQKKDNQQFSMFTSINTLIGLKSCFNNSPTPSY